MIRSYATFFRRSFARAGWLGILLGIGGSLSATLGQAAPSPVPQASLLWKFNFNASPLGKFQLLFGAPNNSGSSTPAIAPDGTAYLGTFNGTFFAISSNGREKWRFKAGLEIHSSPAIAADGTIYFGSRDRHFYALHPDGTLKWKFATGGWVDSSPAIAKDGTIYFGSWDHYFYALNPDGTVKWKFDAGGIVDSSPAIAADGIIYFGSHDKNFYALQPDGSVRWKFQTGGEIVSSPAIGGDGVIYLSSLDGNLYAVNPDGTLRWKIHTGSFTRSSPVINAEGNIAIGNTNRNEVVSKAGHELWNRGSPLPIDATAVAVRGYFYLAAPWRTVAAVAARDHLLWQAGMKENASAALTVDDQGTVYVCAGASLYAFRPPGTSAPLANGPWPMFRGNLRHTGRVEK